MSMRITFIPCLAAVLILGACGKDNGTGPSDGKSALLTGAKWKMSAHTVTPGVDEHLDGTLVTNLFSSEGCSEDDVTQYLPNGKWSVDEGASKCDPSDPQVETGTWKLNAAGDSLSMESDLDGIILKGKLGSLTASEFRLSMHTDWDDGVDHVETLVFSAQ
jgi:hypothetical protein